MEKGDEETGRDVFRVCSVVYVIKDEMMYKDEQEVVEAEESAVSNTKKINPVRLQGTKKVKLEQLLRFSIVDLFS